MSERVLILTRGEQGVMANLGKEQAELERWQRKVDAVKARRDLLVAKLVRSGVPSRTIGAAAHLSSPGVGLVARRAEEANSE
jgi:hypothetical protein